MLPADWVSARLVHLYFWKSHKKIQLLLFREKYSVYHVPGKVPANENMV